MERKKCLLLLDPQNDFFIGSHKKLTSEQIIQIMDYIENNTNSFDGIVLMLDSHYPNDISHPNYWIDFENKHPEIGTIITKKEARGRKYSVFMPDAPREIAEEKQKMAVEYIENLESINIKHVIKPEHCIVGTYGHNVYGPIMKRIIDWTRVRGRDYQMVLKGLYQHSEHFGVFEAAVPFPKVPETMLNQGILQYLDNFDDVYIIGEKDVLLDSLKQLTDCAKELNAPDIIERYVVVSEDKDVVDYCKQIDYRNIGF